MIDYRWRKNDGFEVIFYKFSFEYKNKKKHI